MTSELKNVEEGEKRKKKKKKKKKLRSALPQNTTKDVVVVVFPPPVPPADQEGMSLMLLVLSPEKSFLIMSIHYFPCDSFQPYIHSLVWLLFRGNIFPDK